MEYHFANLIKINQHVYLSKGYRYHAAAMPAQDFAARAQRVCQ